MDCFKSVYNFPNKDQLENKGLESRSYQNQKGRVGVSWVHRSLSFEGGLTYDEISGESVGTIEPTIARFSIGDEVVQYERNLDDRGAWRKWAVYHPTPDGKPVERKVPKYEEFVKEFEDLSIKSTPNKEKETAAEA